MSHYLNILNTCGPVLSHDEQKSLALRAQQGDEQAESILIERNLKFVYATISKYIKMIRPADREDVFYAGVRGMQMAIYKWDPNKGGAFITYAKYWIWTISYREMRKVLSLIKTPHPTKIPTLSQKNHALAMNARRVASIQQLTASGAIDLSDYINGGEATDQDQIEELEHNAHIHGVVLQAMEGMPKRWQEILRMRYGLDNGEAQTLEECALVLGCSRERVRQIQVKALEELRKILNNYN